MTLLDVLQQRFPDSSKTTLGVIVVTLASFKLSTHANVSPTVTACSPNR